MKIIIIITVGLILAGCSQSNYASKKTVISNMTDFVKVNESVCGKYNHQSRNYMVVVLHLQKILKLPNQKLY